MIRFQCCHCDQPIEAPDESLEWEIECPSCHRMVDRRLLKRSGPAHRPSSPLPELDEAEKIRRSAQGLMFLSGVCAVIGFIAGFVTLFTVTSGEDAGSGWLVAAWLIGVAFWFYLVAQIVHIRALLAKK